MDREEVWGVGWGWEQGRGPEAGGTAATTAMCWQGRKPPACPPAPPPMCRSPLPLPSRLTLHPRGVLQAPSPSLPFPPACPLLPSHAPLAAPPPRPRPITLRLLIKPFHPSRLPPLPTPSPLLQDLKLSRLLELKGLGLAQLQRRLRASVQAQAWAADADGWPAAPVPVLAGAQAQAQHSNPPATTSGGRSGSGDVPGQGPGQMATPLLDWSRLRRALPPPPDEPPAPQAAATPLQQLQPFALPAPGPAATSQPAYTPGELAR